MKPFTTSLDRLLLGAAAFVAALAAFVFAVSGGTAHASGAMHGPIGRYQLSTAGNTIEYRIIDTTNGDVFETNSANDYRWEPLPHQLGEMFAKGAP